MKKISANRRTVPIKINLTGKCFRVVSLIRVKSYLCYVTYSVLMIFIVTLSSCTDIPTPVVTPTVPLYQIQAETWRSIDEQILSASVSARKRSKAYALVDMDNWRRRVRRRIEDVFIPWYSSYWTQQSLATRVAWYKMQYSEGETTPEEHLANYLQQQFYEQVLDPVSDHIEPHSIMKTATVIYLLGLKKRIGQLPYEYQIPVTELNKHLKFIPAIVVKTKPLQGASLYDVLQIKGLVNLPAYKILLTQIDVVNGSINPKSLNRRLDSVAKRAVTKLVYQMEVRGSASIASLIVGGPWGVLISAGSATWSISEHEKDKEQMETQIRANLEVMLDMMWKDLVKDTRGGVTAVVHHMSKQIEGSIFIPGPPGSNLF